jgi:hypothetical protein
VRDHWTISEEKTRNTAKHKRQQQTKNQTQGKKRYKDMHKLIALRFALPTVVILAAVTIAIVAIALLTTHHAPGTAWGYP